MTIRTLLVDDSPAFLEGATRLLGTAPGIEIVGRAGSGQEAVEQAWRLAPDLILMDIAMPGMNGLEATRLIKERLAAPRVVMLSLHDAAAYLRASTEAGADGFISKAAFAETGLSTLAAMFPERWWAGGRQS